METGGFHLFGNSCTTIITTETDNYPVIEDEPGKLEVVDNTDLMSGIGHGIANGLLLCAGVVLFAGATAATGGAALLLGGCVLGGHLLVCQRQQTGWWKATGRPGMTGAGETLH